MASHHEAGFASEIFHFDIEYHMTSNLLVSNGVGLVIIEEPEGRFHAGLFLGDGIRPEVVAVLSVDFKSAFDC